MITRGGWEPGYRELRLRSDVQRGSTIEFRVHKMPRTISARLIRRLDHLFHRVEGGRPEG